VCPPYNPLPALDINPTWSPDAGFVAFVHGIRDGADSSGIYVVDTAGSAPVKLSDQAVWTSMELAWSPDGSRIAFYAGDIWTVDVASHSLRKWTSGSPYCHWPTWSPDGRYILYTIIARPAGAPDSVAGFHIIDTSNDTQRALVRDSILAKHGGGPAHWSPDGTSIAFFTSLTSATNLAEMRSDLIMLSADGTSWRRVITVDGIAENPQWSPDGRKLFFALTPPPCLPNDSGLTATWVVNTDGTGLRQWPVNLGEPRVTFAFPFALSRVGQRVAFVGLDGTATGGVIWAMNLDGTGRRQLTQP